MRLFAVSLNTPPSRAGASELSRRLLAYAVELVWGIPCPKIGRAENGKPFFLTESGMFFSVSHTKTCVLVGVSEYDLGVDAETLRPYAERTATRLFSGEMLEAFGYFGGWTLRESLFKLTGQGSLRNMDFHLENGKIVPPVNGVKCRLYRDIPGCAAAAACFDGVLPPNIEIVDLADI